MDWWRFVTNGLIEKTAVDEETQEKTPKNPTESYSFQGKVLL